MASKHWADIQENTFVRWCNDELKRRGMCIKNLKTDLQDGLILINLMEIISGQKLPRYNKHPRIDVQKTENLGIAIKFIQDQGIKLVNVGPEDILQGNLRIILGLIWTLILRYEIQRGSGEDADGANDLLKWIQSKIPEYNITGFKKDWNDGRAVCALVDAVRPGKFPEHKDLDPADKLNNATRGIDAAEQIGVDRLIYPEEMTDPKVDKLAMMTYLAQFRNLPEYVHPARLARAYGPGLVEGIMQQGTEFYVENVHGKLEVKVFGPQDEAKCDVKEQDGVYTVHYTPTTPGVYKVHVTVDGEHILGSIFEVVVLQEESLGGENKIHVYYSTASANELFKKGFQSLQTMFEAKKIHLRPDFTPWIAIDLMTKEDRDIVYRKAGVRKLPLVFVNDVYVGGWDELSEINEQGRLDDVLKIESNVQLLSEEEHLERLKSIPADSKDAKEDA